MGNEDNATFSVGDQQTTCPLVRDTKGQLVIDVSGLNTNYCLFDQGYKHTAAHKSSICYIDGDAGILTYRGIDIAKLATSFDFLQTSYLLLFNKLPDDDSLFDFSSRLASVQKKAYLSKDIMSCIDTNAHPMVMLSALMAKATTDYACEIPVTDEKAQQEMMLDIIGYMPVFVALCHRHANNLAPIAPRSDLSYSANFLYMISGEEPLAQHTKVLDTILILHAEHEQNASTNSVRSVASTGTHPYAAIASGISALWGPAHGGANEACVRMLEDIADVANIPATIAKAKDKNNSFRLMGFGHRVYKNYDPRAKIMQQLCHEVLGDNNSPLFKVAKELENIALNDDYFIQRKLYPNVDFYSGITLQALGIRPDCFTTIFCLARTVGWASHLLEQYRSTVPIDRPKQWYTGP